jgi:uncharacterized membrane protein YhfC
LNGFLMIAMPLGLAVFLTQKFHLDWRLWGIGAATFVLSQVVHLPFNAWFDPVFDQFTFIALHPTWQLLLRAAFLGLSAGLFEELFRYGMFRWWARDARKWSEALLAGAGHGGAESILLGAYVLFVFVQLVALRGEDLSRILPASRLALALQQVAAYWSAAWYDSVLGAVERLCTIPVQICFAVIVLQTFRRRQWFWVWLAVLYHALVDATAVLAITRIGIYWTEAMIAGYAVVSLVIIFLLRQSEPLPDLGAVPQKPQPHFTPKAVEETPENLDSTRYQ